MKLEHFALNVEDPVAMREWYAANLGLSAVRKLDEAPFTTFMADDSGSIMVEVYCNPINQVPDYRKMDPLLIHLAFVSDDPGKDSQRLIAAGAEIISDQRLEDGSHIVMLRDPWGLAIQLCKRAMPMLR